MNPTFQAGLGSFNMPTSAGAAGGLAGGANRGASGPVVFNLNMDGQRFAQVVVPDILTAMQQRGRSSEPRDLADASRSRYGLRGSGGHDSAMTQEVP